ncbi:MAG: hypothetical protein U1E76_11125 [Planctomycetota bacterium]
MFRTPHAGLRLRGLFTSLSVAVWFLLAPGSLPVTPGHVALASMGYSTDRDHDLLSDAFEQFLDTQPQDADSDGDGIPDGFEFVLRSNPRDPASRPTIKPGMRMSAFQDGENLKVTFYLLPADITQLEAYSCYLLANNQSRVPPIDISSMIPAGVTETGLSVYKGILASSFSLSLPLSLVKRVAPVSIGMAARISGVAFADVLRVDMVDGVPMIARGLGIPPEVDPSIDQNNLPWDPLSDDVPDDWGDQQICVTGQTEVGCDQGVATYEITSAGCDAQVNRACPPNCSSRVGQTVTTIDYAFLIASVSSGY